MSLTHAAPAGALSQDTRTIGLIGLAHGVSHFHHLLLAPLFPVFGLAFNLSYAQMGLLMTVFFIISGIGQALSGFLVDRIGARPVLFAALGCFFAADLAAATAHGYGGLMLAAMLAGLGNAPFHPVDFTILNQRVSAPRLGHAFSVHGISGNLGWAAAPVTLIGLHEATGSWRVAYLVVALVTLTTMMLLAWQRAAIDDRANHRTAGPEAPAQAAGQAATAPASTRAVLAQPAVWLCFAFFFWTSAALGAIQSFASPALQALYGLPHATTAFVITGYMLCGAAGMVVGGFLVARAQRLERTIAAAMALSALMLALAASGLIAPWMAAGAVVLGGLGTGLAGPSRDMLIKQAAPTGATGRVYGLVYSGLDVGVAASAPLFGHWMDRQQPAMVFAGAAALLTLGIASAAVVGRRVAAQRSV